MAGNRIQIAHGMIYQRASPTVGNDRSWLMGGYGVMIHHSPILWWPVSSGSTTTSPTNDEISITFSDAMQLVATSLSGIHRSNKVPNFDAMVETLDPIMARTATQFNTTLPNSLALVAIMMRDAGQFLILEGFNQTFAAIGPDTTVATTATV
ncbi:hypothetical protein B0H15DRAFT_803384 [Mycena belliarum]|uniref:Uncharacterized protein n=1 Tax=Mycena belliarum TaxID=1033014 RepID=A0AAD6TYD7_9AGAR|nr:hypothetical protein B0H15DRAFT_803384 [Mycena belliae]